MTRYFRFTSGGVVWPERKVGDGDRPHAKPVVVIDPEDREQVERLIRASVGTHSGCPDVLEISAAQIDHMQAALREFANPQPPEVFEHYLSEVAADGSGVAFCGKVWQPGQDVTVAGRCPSCEEIVAKGWTA